MGTHIGLGNTIPTASADTTDATKQQVQAHVALGHIAVSPFPVVPLTLLLGQVA